MQRQVQSRMHRRPSRQGRSNTPPIIFQKRMAEILAMLARGKSL